MDTKQILVGSTLAAALLVGGVGCSSSTNGAAPTTTASVASKASDDGASTTVADTDDAGATDESTTDAGGADRDGDSGGIMGDVGRGDGDGTSADDDGGVDDGGAVDDGGSVDDGSSGDGPAADGALPYGWPDALALPADVVLVDATGAAGSPMLVRARVDGDPEAALDELEAQLTAAEWRISDRTFEPTDVTGGFSTQNRQLAATVSLGPGEEAGTTSLTITVREKTSV